MRATLLFGIVAFSLSAFSQIADVPGRDVYTTKVADSSYNWYLDVSLDKWQVYTKMINTYDSRGNLTKAAFWIVEPPNSWINQFTFHYTYNEYDSLTIALLKAEDENYLMLENVYDPLRRLVSQTMKEWDGMIWVTATVQTYTYDNENKLITHTDTQMPANGTYYVFTHTYDDADYQVKKLTEYYVDFVIYSKAQNIYEYDSYGNRVSDVYQDWQQNSWVNFMRTDYTYDGRHNQLSVEEYSWNTGSWSNLRKRTNTYDNQDNLVNYSGFTWNGFVWKETSTGRQTFDQDKFMISDISWYYDFEGELMVGDSNRYYPKEPLGIREFVQTNPLHIYPNPGNGLFSLVSEMPMDAIEIFNPAGVKIQSITPTNSHNILIDLTDQAKGMYIVKTKSADRVGVGKILLK